MYEKISGHRYTHVEIFHGEKNKDYSNGKTIGYFVPFFRPAQHFAIYEEGTDQHAEKADDEDPIHRLDPSFGYVVVNHTGIRNRGFHYNIEFGFFKIALPILAELLVPLLRICSPNHETKLS